VPDGARNPDLVFQRLLQPVSYTRFVERSDPGPSGGFDDAALGIAGATNLQQPNYFKDHVGSTHTRHRSQSNFFVNLLAGLVAYTFREKKPSLNLRLQHALPGVVL
jgi:hypothetical protein